MSHRIQAAMPYKAGEEYDPKTPALKAARFTGRRSLTGAPRALTVAQMRESVLADHSDATDFRKVGHSRCVFRVSHGELIVFRYHATDIAQWDTTRHVLTLRAHREERSPDATGWHAPATRNAWVDAIPALLGTEWTCRAHGAGHNRSGVIINGPGYRGAAELGGRKSAIFLLPGKES